MRSTHQMVRMAHPTNVLRSWNPRRFSPSAPPRQPKNRNLPASVYNLSEAPLPHAAPSLIAVTHVAERLTTELLGEEDLDVGSSHYESALIYLGIDETELEELRDELVAALNNE